jgi:hypothetical protein
MLLEGDESLRQREAGRFSEHSDDVKTAIIRNLSKHVQRQGIRCDNAEDSLARICNTVGVDPLLAQMEATKLDDFDDRYFVERAAIVIWSRLVDTARKDGSAVGRLWRLFEDCPEESFGGGAKLQLLRAIHAVGQGTRIEALLGILSRTTDGQVAVATLEALKDNSDVFQAADRSLVQTAFRRALRQTDYSVKGMVAGYAAHVLQTALGDGAIELLGEALAEPGEHVREVEEALKKLNVDLQRYPRTPRSTEALAEERLHRAVADAHGARSTHQRQKAWIDAADDFRKVIGNNTLALQCYVELVSVDPLEGIENIAWSWIREALGGGQPHDRNDATWIRVDHPMCKQLVTLLAGLPRQRRADDSAERMQAVISSVREITGRPGEAPPEPTVVLRA